MRARARHTDPMSSHLAAAEVESSGTAYSQRMAVLSALMRYDGATSAELADAMQGDRYTPSRRLPELREHGLVTNGLPRHCTVAGRMAQTWYVVTGKGGAE